METKIEQLPKNTVKLTVKLPNDKVKDSYQHVLTHFAEEIEVPGFRKGKAPLDLVEKNAKQSELNGETVNHLLRTYYGAALKEHHISPVGNPKVTIKSFSKDEPFEFEATIATKPDIKLGNYRKKLKEVFDTKNKRFKEEQEKSTTNKDSKETTDTQIKAEHSEHAHGDHVHLTVDEVINAVSDVAELEISEVLIEDEVTRMLSRLLQQAETLGLTVEQYLSAQNKTADQLRKDFEESANKSLKAEFALAKAIELESIKVEDNEVEEAINAVGDEATRNRLKSGVDRWYILSVLAKNKLIAKLANELEPHKSEDSKKEEK